VGITTWNNESFVVFGGTGGIGSAVCRELRARGAAVGVVGRTEAKVTALCAEIGADGWTGDAADVATVQRIMAEAQARFGRVSGVVNAVGSLLLKPVHLTSGAEWNETIGQNLGTAFAVTRSAVKAVEAPGGSIVLVSSAAARTGLANHEAIAAAKAGIIGLTLSAAATYASQGIRINCVAPGLTKTPLTHRIVSNPDSEKFSRSMHALGTLGEPDDVAQMIVYLLGAESRWVTGQVFGVDGGLSSVRPKATA
jgi:3-oxoacyl-[acyl-carrier protein] reductase